MLFSDTIKSVRKLNKLTQKELAEKLGVTQQTVCKWERGFSKPDLEIYLIFLRMFNLNIDEAESLKKEDNYYKALDFYERYQRTSEKNKRIIDLILSDED